MSFYPQVRLKTLYPLGYPFHSGCPQMLWSLDGMSAALRWPTPRYTAVGLWEVLQSAEPPNSGRMVESPARAAPDKLLLG